MAGWNNKKGKSNNAVNAEQQGMMNATKLSKLIKVSSIAITRFMQPLEWHHTSRFFNQTNYYYAPCMIAIIQNRPLDKFEPEFVELSKKTLEEMKEFDKYYRAEKRKEQIENKKHGITYLNCRVSWVEWVKEPKRHPKPKNHNEIADVTVTGGDFVSIHLKSGKIFRKKIGARGFSYKFPKKFETKVA
jgi:hypothetical protein